MSALGTGAMTTEKKLDRHKFNSDRYAEENNRFLTFVKLEDEDLAPEPSKNVLYEFQEAAVH